jgi:Gram-negative bacterial TonB protein C-terminal
VTNIPSILQTPEEPESAAGVPKQSSGQLLELRSETGTVYLRPSRLQRLRLRWTFRHFRKLPPELLSRSDRRMVQKMSRSAVVTPKLPVARGSVLGVVETVRPTLPPAGLRLVSSRSSSPANSSPATSLATSVATPLATPAAIKPLTPIAKPAAPPAPAAQSGKAANADLPSGQWRALGALAGVGVVVILASAVKMPPFPSQMHTHNVPSAAPPSVKKPSPAMVAGPSVQQPRRWIAPLPPESTMVHQELATLTDSDEADKPIVHTVNRPQVPPVSVTPPTAKLIRSIATGRALVAELPPAPFAKPVVPERNLVGELQLKALIGSDGSVKEVTVLSGNPVLAKAGMRAVRQWHYGVSQMPGGASEMETHIKMSFFGEDAVSIASIGKYN